MSRGGSGGRGGRGGGRGGRSGPTMPWAGEEVDGRPSDTFPPYTFPCVGPISETEQRHVNAFLLFRRHVHDGPLFTRKHAPNPLRPQRLYDQTQRNAQYAVRNKATFDAFRGMDTYSSRFRARERNLPDFSTRPYVKTLFPAELQETLSGGKGRGGKSGEEGRKRLKLSTIRTLPTAEDVFGVQEEEGEALQERWKRLEAEGEEGGEEEREEDEEREEELEDYAYDEDEEGDYNAEGYFDDGDGDGDDGDEGGDDAVF